MLSFCRGILVPAASNAILKLGGPLKWKKRSVKDVRLSFSGIVPFCVALGALYVLCGCNEQTIFSIGARFAPKDALTYRMAVEVSLAQRQNRSFSNLQRSSAGWMSARRDR